MFVLSPTRAAEYEVRPLRRIASPSTMPYPVVTYSSQVLPTNCEAPRPRWQEWFSWAFVQSVANAAGLVAQVPTIDSNKKDVMLERGDR